MGENTKDQTLVSSGWLRFVKASRLDVRRGLITFVYYALARHLPNPPMPGCGLGAWLRRWWAWCDRLHYTSVLLALILFLWFLNSWNLLGFRF